MRERKFHKKIPLASWLLILVALGSLGTGTVAAYLSYATKPVTNTFTPDHSETPTVVAESQGTSNTALAVSVGNTGYTVYVRAAVVVNWEQGNKSSNSDKNEVLFHKPPVEGVDYEIKFNIGDDKPWFKHSDGFYYYKAPVASNGVTEPLINNYATLQGGESISGYFKELDVVVQTIQALGKTDGDATANPRVDPIPAVTDAWKVFVDQNGYLTPTDPTT